MSVFPSIDQPLCYVLSVTQDTTPLSPARPSGTRIYYSSRKVVSNWHLSSNTTESYQFGKTPLSYRKRGRPAETLSRRRNKKSNVNTWSSLSSSWEQKCWWGTKPIWSDKLQKIRLWLPSILDFTFVSLSRTHGPLLFISYTSHCCRCFSSLRGSGHCKLAQSSVTAERQQTGLVASTGRWVVVLLLCFGRPTLDKTSVVRFWDPVLAKWGKVVVVVGGCLRWEGGVEEGRGGQSVDLYQLSRLLRPKVMK